MLKLIPFYIVYMYTISQPKLDELDENKYKINSLTVH
jgi:hypothetical protein